MTLILTALCKNGICVCADKRVKTWTGGTLKIEDNLNKIYRFNDIPLIVFNHGVNKFNNKSWREFCSDYDNSNRWKDKTIKLISEDFKSFIENDIVQQLRSNIQNMPNVSSVQNTAFVLCGRNIKDNIFEFHELYWSPKLTVNSWKDTRLICSGEGSKYLEEYLDNNSQSNTVEFWKTKNTDQAKEKIEELFSIAVSKRNQLNGDEFSDDYDVECIN